MLKHRMLTALIAMPLFIVAILFLPYNWFWVLSTLIVIGCAWEWSAFSGISHMAFRIAYVVLIVLALGLTFYIPFIYFLLLALVVWLFAFVSIIVYAKHKGDLGVGHQLTKLILGFLMLVPFWLSMNMLQGSTNIGPVLLLIAFILVWSVDVGAYFVGRFCGRRKLIERVSPNKTWEGFVSGVVACVIVAFIIGFIRHMPWPQMLALGLLGLIVALFSVVGDLFESMLKRQLGIKDSGTILPGHGGFLDRFDSAIAALPIFMLGMLLMGAMGT